MIFRQARWMYHRWRAESDHHHEADDQDDYHEEEDDYDIQDDDNKEDDIHGIIDHEDNGKVNVPQNLITIMNI